MSMYRTLWLVVVLCCAMALLSACNGNDTTEPDGDTDMVTDGDDQQDEEEAPSEIDVDPDEVTDGDVEPDEEPIVDGDVDTEGEMPAESETETETEEAPPFEACDPNPCTEGVRTVCQPDGESDYVCLCEDGYCDINDECIADGAMNPDNDCQKCDEAGDSEAWSPVTAGTSCGDHQQCDGIGACLCMTGYTGAECDQCDTGYQDNNENGVCDMGCDHPDACQDAPYLCDDSDGHATCQCAVNTETEVAVGEWPYAMAVSGTNAFVAMQNSIKMYDVTDPTAPQLLAEKVAGSNNSGLAASGDIAYAFSSGGTLTSVDFSDPNVPETVQDLSVATDGGALSITDSTLCAAARNEGIFLVSTDTAGNMSPLGSYPFTDTHSCQIIGDRAYVGDGTLGMVILDISDPANISQISAYRHPDLGYYWDVMVRDTLAFASVGNEGFEVIDISNPAAPVSLGIHSPGGYTYQVRLHENTAFVACMESGIMVLDISDPASPQHAGHYFTSPFDPSDPQNSYAARWNDVVNDGLQIYALDTENNVFGTVEHMPCIRCGEGRELDLENHCLSRETVSASGDIIITEFNAYTTDGPNDSEYEWFEIVNTNPDVLLTLDQCTLKDDDGEEVPLISPMVWDKDTGNTLDMYPGIHYALAPMPEWNRLELRPSEMVFRYYGSAFHLDNDGDEIVIECDGVEIARIEYNASHVTQYMSYALDADMYQFSSYQNLNDNWCTCNDNVYDNYFEMAGTEMIDEDLYGTPGLMNGTCAP